MLALRVGSKNREARLKVGAIDRGCVYRRGLDRHHRAVAPHALIEKQLDSNAGLPNEARKGLILLSSICFLFMAFGGLPRGQTPFCFSRARSSCNDSDFVSKRKQRFFWIPALSLKAA